MDFEKLDGLIYKSMKDLLVYTYEVSRIRTAKIEKAAMKTVSPEY